MSHGGKGVALTQVPLQSCSGEHGRVDAHREKPTSLPKVLVVHMYLVLSLRVDIEQRQYQRDGEADRVEQPSDIIIRDGEDPFPCLSEFVQIGKRVDCLVQATGETAQDHYIIL